jgi:hypothetical protein
MVQGMREVWMTIAFASLSLPPLQVSAPWMIDWVWGCALIVLTLMTHVLGLGIMSRVAIRVHNKVINRPHPIAIFVMFMGATAFLATILHAIEAVMWAAAYWAVGALPDYRSATLYSLNAMTTYGHETHILEGHWQMIGAIEALDGWLLFGLSTAFLFWLFQLVLPGKGGDH